MTSISVSSVVVIATLAAMAVPGFAAAADSASSPGIEIHANAIQEIPATFGQPNARVQLTAQVQLAGLDLNRTQDVVALRERVAQTAAQVCAELGQQYRGMLVSGDDSVECVRDAVEGAQGQINQAVAATLAQQRAG